MYIKSIHYSNVRYFKLVDSNGVDVPGTYLEQELHSIHNPNIKFVEKKIKNQKNRVLVQYLGHAPWRSQEWIKKTQVQ